MGEAFEWIRRGRAPMMLSGGAEATITALGIGGFSAMFALSRATTSPERASRPWDKGRDGFVCGGGRGVARARVAVARQGARRPIYGEVTGLRRLLRRVPPHEARPEGEGASAHALGAQADARLDPSAIGYVNAHGTSTPHGDLEEARAVIEGVRRRTLTDKKLWVSSTKSVMGHLLGGAAGSRRRCRRSPSREGKVPPTINLEDPDPERLSTACRIDRASAHARHVMSQLVRLRRDQRTLVFSRRLSSSR
jgi:3-oxoacyl-[acyl-carrier-protein] synthase II